MLDKTQHFDLKTIFGNMADTIYQLIMQGRELEKSSGSDDYKIAASLYGVGPDGNVSIFSQANKKLTKLEKAVDGRGSIAGASNTIHAETAVIMDARVTDGMDLYVTDPLCPNCMKNAIEAGVSRIFIDERGFDKKWYQNRGPYFNDISIKLAELAGVDVIAVDPDKREARRLTPEPLDKAVKSAHPAEIIELSEDIDYEDFLADSFDKFGETPFAMAVGYNLDGKKVLIRTVEAYTPGMNDDLAGELDTHNAGNKYRYKSDPVTRLLMESSKHGVSLRGSHLYCSHMPSARCQVNIVGYGMDEIRIDRIHDDTRTDDLEAACILGSHNILHYKFDGPDVDLSDLIDAHIEEHPQDTTKDAPAAS